MSYGGMLQAQERRTLAKYEPEEGKVLVFVGQDNRSMGGNDALKLYPPGKQQWKNGYVDFFREKIGMPAGLTHYVYMTEGKTNAFGKTFSENVVYGLNSVHEWAAGDMCLRCYLQNDTNYFNGSVIHLSISMEFSSEKDIAAGKFDHLIEELGDFLLEFRTYPFMIRIGYEFEGAWNGYEPKAFKEAFRRIVDRLKARNIDNFATVLASSNMFVKEKVWNRYYPGDDYVDWVGYSFFDPGHRSSAGALSFARKHNKPVFIAEATPWKTTNTAIDDGDQVWKGWFEPFFEHIEVNKDIIKAISYINSEWVHYEMWQKNDVFKIDTRLELNKRLTELWTEKMNTDGYIHSVNGTYQLIRFENKEK